MARPKRFELLTPRFVVWCSIQLSYGRVFSRGPRTYASRPLMASLGGSVAWGAFGRARRRPCLPPGKVVGDFRCPTEQDTYISAPLGPLRVPVLPQEIAHEPAKSNAHTGNSPTCRILCPCP